MWITNLLNELGINQSELATATGVPASAISMHLSWERGEGGRRLGPELSARIVRTYPNKLTLPDLRPELEIDHA